MKKEAEKKAREDAKQQKDLEKKAKEEARLLEKQKQEEEVRRKKVRVLILTDLFTEVNLSIVQERQQAMFASFKAVAVEGMLITSAIDISILTFNLQLLESQW